VGKGPDIEQSFWPQFHGPKRDNLSTEKGLLKKWPEEGPALLWRSQELGHGYSSVSISGGMIYTAGNIEEETVITALNMEGKILWQVKNGKGWTGDRPGTRGTPTIDGDRVYHESPLGDIICLKAGTGEKIWGLNILDKFKGKNIKWALSESLLVDGDNIICCPGGPQTCMVAMDKNTGAVVWKAASTNEPAGYASPIVAEYKGLRIIITLTLKGMIGVNADTGELQWHVKHISYADENVMMPIYHDGQVFVSTIKAGSVKWKINIKDGKASVEEIWRSKELDNHHGGGVLVNGYIYSSSCIYNGSKWICLDWETGEKRYADKGIGKGSLTYADGMLYMLSENRAVGLVRPTPDSYGLINSFEIPKGGKGNSWAHPVVCGGRLYIRHGDFLYTYSIR
jgi:outer membrane protein assembly factor BamB